MKIDFRILWVDDNEAFAESIFIHLEGWLEKKGFELLRLAHPNADNVINDIKNNEIELIIIDYKLPGKDGDELISEIRENGFYHDIIFYSESDLPEGAIPGVHYVQKKDARQRVTDLLNHKISRSSEFSNMRGWIVTDSIELEILLTNILGKCFSDNPGFRFSKKILGYGSHRNILGFHDKFSLVNGLIAEYTKNLKTQPKPDVTVIKNLESHKEILNSFSDDIINYRNAFAHQKIELGGEEKIIYIYKGKSKTKHILNDEFYISIRKNIKKHRDNLVKICELLP